MSDPKTSRDNKTAALQAPLPANQAYPATDVPQFKEIVDRSITQIDQAKFAEVEQIDSQSDNALPDESTNMALNYPAPLAGAGLMFDSEQTILLAQASIESEYGAAVAEEASGGLASGAAAGATAGAAGFASENAGLLALGGLGLIAIAGSGGGDGGIYYKTNLTFANQPVSFSGNKYSLGTNDLWPQLSAPGNISIDIVGGQYSSGGVDRNGSSFQGASSALTPGTFIVYASDYEQNQGVNDVLIAWNQSGTYYGWVLHNLQSDTQYINVEGYTFALTWSGPSISNISLA